MIAGLTRDDHENPPLTPTKLELTTPYASVIPRLMHDKYMSDQNSYIPLPGTHRRGSRPFSLGAQLPTRQEHPVSRKRAAGDYGGIA